jgi:cytochrome c oxidase assembly protein subunit 15
LNASAQTTDDPWLHRFAVLTAVITFFLLGIGGLVTSHEAGMSVPDWPTSYGYNMFALPIKFWKGGAFFEHSHRLLASGAGFLTTVLAIWLWLKDPRKRMKWLGVLAFLLVVAQGVLGGLRVTMHMDSLGIFHGVLAQSFFVLTCAIALFTSRWWMGLERRPPARHEENSVDKYAVPEAGAPLRGWVLTATLLIFGQLILGATMRHQHAGLAIPDFPLAYGKIWPGTSANAVTRYNAERIEINGENPITAFQIELQMVHRIVAVLILIAVAACAWMAREMGAPGTVPARTGDDLKLAVPVLGAPIHRRISIFWLALIVCQIALGAWTIWSNKAADVTTAHVLVGALSLVTGALWCIIAFRRPMSLPEIVPATTISGVFGTPPAMAANK